MRQEPHLTYHSCWVRALAWCLLTPSLTRLPRGLRLRGRHWQPAQIRRALQHLDRQPALLEQAFDDQPGASPQRPPLLGFRFEQLVAFYLRQHPAVETVITNLQVPGSQGTLGEFDLLYRVTGEAAYRHLEMAVKFYLRPFPGRHSRAWVGLNPDDRLDIKAHRMLSHQLRLGATREGRELLKQRGIHLRIREALIRGCFYYPWTEFCGEPVPPRIAGTPHLAGWWLDEADRQVLNTPNAQFAIQRGDSRLTAQLLRPEQRLCYDALMEQVFALRAQARFSRPLMLSRWAAGSHTPERGLLVPDEWLQRLAARDRPG